MKVFPWITEEFHSPLNAAELIRWLQASTLPAINGSWRDNFEVNPAQPFEGKISADSFVITRISVLRIRHAQPPSIQGWVRVDPSNTTASVLRLQYCQRKMAAAVVIGSYLLALCLATWCVVKDWRISSAISPWWLIYFLLPVVAIATQYFQLQTEADKVRPFLTKLLQLKPVTSLAA